MFAARNRVIAGLAAATVVVEAAEGSGALVTASASQLLSRPVGAVPGRVSSPLAAGPNALLAAGASVVRGAHDVIELLGAVVPTPDVSSPIRPSSEVAPPEPGLAGLLAAIGAGADTAAALAAVGFELKEALAGVASLELSGHVRRGAGGRLIVAM
jgi:DNA processing protein